MIYWLDETTRNARLHARGVEAVAVGGGRDFSIQIAPDRFLNVGRFVQVEDLLANDAEENLGSRRIAGVETRGRRLALTVPVGYLGNHRPIEIVDERWESPELRLVIESRYSDSRIGFVAYRLKNIRRDEPRPDLFVIPDGYKHNAPAETPLASFSSFERSCRAAVKVPTGEETAASRRRARAPRRAA